MNKRILFGVLMICAVAALVAIGTWAYFSDYETSYDNKFTAGSLDLKVDTEDDPTVATYFNVECVKPGDNGAVPIVLSNVGCVDGIADIHLKWLANDENVAVEPELNAHDDPDDLGNIWDGELAQNLDMRISADLDMSGTYETVVAVGKLDPDVWCINWTIGPLDADSSIGLLIEWSVAPTVGNIIMTDIVKFDIEFSLNQAVGKPFEPHLSNLVQPATALVCDTVTITVDVTNAGDIGGSVTVSLDIGALPPMEKLVSLAGGQTKTATFTWHPEAAGDYDVVASLPSEEHLHCPEPIEVLTPPEASADWTDALPTTVYVCDTLVIGVTAENVGMIADDFDISVVIKVDSTVKYTKTQTVTLVPGVPVSLTFGPWHVQDPVTMSGTVELKVGGVTVKTHTMTVIDLDPVVTEISPETSTVLTPPGAVAITARVQDKSGVVAVGYNIDVPDPLSAVPMVLFSGDEYDGYYQGVVPWDYSAATLSDHAVIVGAFDTAMNFGVASTVVHVQKAVFTYSNLTVTPNPVVFCNDVTISVTVTNNGNIEGTIHVEVTVDSTKVIDQDVTLDPDESVTLTYTFHPDAGSYTVSCDGLPPVTLVVTLPPEWWTPDGGWWKIPVESVGAMTLWMSMGGAPPDPNPAVPAPSYSTYELWVSTTISSGSAEWRELVVPQASYWAPIVPVYSEAMSAWITMIFSLTADGTGSLYVNAEGDVDYAGETTHAGTALTWGDLTLDPAGSAKIYMPMQVEVYMSSTEPPPDGPYGTKVATIPMASWSTTATCSNHVTEAAPMNWLDNHTVAGMGVPFAAAGGPAPYVGTVGTLCGTGAALDLSLLWYSVDVQFVGTNMIIPGP